MIGRCMVPKPSRITGYLKYTCLQQRGLLTNAFARGPYEPPLLEQTIPQHFASIVSAFGDRTAVISRHQNVHLTYRKLHENSNALARGLQKLGVKKGDRVAVSLITYSLFKLGAILVPLNPAFSATQVVSALNHLSASHLVIGLETNLPWKSPNPNIPLLTTIIPNLYGSTHPTSSPPSATVPSLQKVIIVDNAQGRIDASDIRSATQFNHVLEDGGDGGRDLHVVDELHADEIVNIQFTSGTTSMPKAACLTHRSILNNGKSIGDRMLLTENDIICCPPPLFHCFGCILGYMASATHGSTIVFPTEAFNPLETLRAVQDYACTALYGVPTMFLSYLSLISSGAVPLTGFQHLRTGIAAGSSIPAELMRRLHQTLNLTQLTICYGMTETSPVSAMTTTDDPLEKRIGSVGRLLPNVSAKVVDPVDGERIVNVGERGELAVNGYLVMKGYWGDEEKTKEVMKEDHNGDIWMHTGDEAIMDAEGYIKITGRLKDIIIRGGENLHPLDIENCLLAHPRISDISACGIPDPHYGEVVGVFVIPQDGGEGRESLGEQEVKDWVRERLGGMFVPKYVFYTDSFPKTPSGKVQRFKLRDEAMRRLKGEGKMGEVDGVLVGKTDGVVVGKEDGVVVGKTESGGIV